MLTRLLASLGVKGIVALVATVGFVGSVYAYLGKRDSLVEAELALDIAYARAENLADRLVRQANLAKAAEQARLDLAARYVELESQEAEVVTEIREIWRDRIVREENPVAVECAPVAVPDGVLLQYCAASGSTTGACAVRANPDGPSGELLTAATQG